MKCLFYIDYIEYCSMRRQCCEPNRGYECAPRTCTPTLNPSRILRYGDGIDVVPGFILIVDEDHQVAKAALLLNKNPKTQYNTKNTTTMIPANFSIATLFPCCAIRPNRPALDRIDVDIEEKTSFWDEQKSLATCIFSNSRTHNWGSAEGEALGTHTAIYQALIPCVVVYVYRDAS